MNRKSMLLLSSIVLLGALVLAIPAHAYSVSWQGITWTNPYGDIAVNGSNYLEVTASTCFPNNAPDGHPSPVQTCWGAAHYNTPSTGFRDQTVQWIQVVFVDDGTSKSPGPQFWIEDETYDPSLAGKNTGTLGGWSQFGAWDNTGAYKVYWWDYDSNKAKLVSTGISRSAGDHTLKIVLDKTDGYLVEYYLDGNLVYSTTKLTLNYIGDVYLAVNGHLRGAGSPYNENSVAVFKEYETGTTL
jgi:hypothetical protein